LDRAIYRNSVSTCQWIFRLLTKVFVFTTSWEIKGTSTFNFSHLCTVRRSTANTNLKNFFYLFLKHGVAVGRFFRNILNYIPMLDNFSLFETENIDNGFAPIFVIQLGIQVKNYKIAIPITLLILARYFGCSLKKTCEFQSCSSNHGSSPSQETVRQIRGQRIIRLLSIPQLESLKITFSIQRSFWQVQANRQVILLPVRLCI
jgi:hypothetical protein